MLTAVNEKTKLVQEVMATGQGELLGAERPAQIAFVDATHPLPVTGPCRCLAITVFASEESSATLRIMDGGKSTAIMEAFASAGWWGSFVLPRGVSSSGNLVANLLGVSAYGYVYYIAE